MERDIILCIDDDPHIFLFRQSRLHQIRDLEDVILLLYQTQLLTVVGILICGTVVEHTGCSQNGHHDDGKHHQHALLVLFRITLDAFQLLTDLTSLISGFSLDGADICRRMGSRLTLLTFLRQLRLFFFRRRLLFSLASDPKEILQ